MENTSVPTEKGKTMSERQEKKKRYNQRLEYIAAFDRWLAQEPNILRRRKWKRWKANRPIWKGDEE